MVVVWKRFYYKIFERGSPENAPKIRDVRSMGGPPFYRGVAQLGARMAWDHKVARSNRVTPTKIIFKEQGI